MAKTEYIPDDDDLYRRIPPDWYVEKEDRVSSAAFKDRETSVEWSKYCTPDKTVREYPNYHVAALQAKIPRTKNLEVKHNPSRHSYAHSLIIGEKPLSIARFLAQNCRFVLKSV